jgi:hypothetical protein
MENKDMYEQFVGKFVVLLHETPKGKLRHQGLVRGVTSTHLFLFDNISNTAKSLRLEEIVLCESQKQE